MELCLPIFQCQDMMKNVFIHLLKLLLSTCFLSPKNKIFVLCVIVVLPIIVFRFQYFLTIFYCIITGTSNYVIIQVIKYEGNLCYLDNIEKNLQKYGFCCLTSFYRYRLPWNQICISISPCYQQEHQNYIWLFYKLINRTAYRKTSLILGLMFAQQKMLRNSGRCLVQVNMNVIRVKKNTLLATWYLALTTFIRMWTTTSINDSCYLVHTMLLRHIYFLSFKFKTHYRLGSNILSEIEQYHYSTQ